MGWAGQSLQGRLLKPAPRLVTHRPSRRRTVRCAELENKGPNPEKRKTCSQTVRGAGCGFESDT